VRPDTDKLKLIGQLFSRRACAPNFLRAGMPAVQLFSRRACAPAFLMEQRGPDPPGLKRGENFIVAEGVRLASAPFLWNRSEGAVKTRFRSCLRVYGKAPLLLCPLRHDRHPAGRCDSQETRFPARSLGGNSPFRRGDVLPFSLGTVAARRIIFRAVSSRGWRRRGNSNRRP